MQVLLDDGKGGRAEQGHVVVCHEQVALIAVVDRAQEVGAARERRRAAMHRVRSAPYIQAPGLLGHADMLPAFDGPAAVAGRCYGQRDVRIAVLDMHASHGGRGVIGARDAELGAVEQPEQLHGLGFGKLQGAADRRALPAKP